MKPRLTLWGTVTRPTLAQLLDRSMQESLSSKRAFGASKLYTIKLIQRYPIGKIYADALTAVDYIEHIKLRLAGYGDDKPVKPQTVKHDVDQFGLVIERAVRYWKIPGVSLEPLKDAKYIAQEEGLVGKSKPRDRRPTEDEISRILAAAQERMAWRTTKIPLPVIFEFAYTSGRRISETCRMVWGDVNGADMTVWVRNMKDPKQKEGNHVETPLLGRAWDIVMAQPRLTDDPDERIFPYNPQSCGAAFRAVCDKLGIKDLRLHDSRRECASRAFEGRLTGIKYSVPQVQLITGHKRPDMLLNTYTKLHARDLQPPKPILAETLKEQA